MRLKSLLLFLPIFAFASNFPTQVTTPIVGIGTTAPNAKSVLDIVSTTKGVLDPRMTTTQKNAIAAPPEALKVYDSTLHAPAFYNGSAWLQVGTITGTETLTNKTLASPGLTGFLNLVTTATPANPTSTDLRLYNDAGVLKVVDSAGTVSALVTSSNNMVISSSSGSFTTTSTSYVNVTNLTATITASGSRPIQIMTSPVQSASLNSYIRFDYSSGSSPGQWKLTKDGTQIAQGFFGSQSATSDHDMSPSLINMIDPSPTAGSHTYLVQTKVGGAGSTAIWVEVVLVVREL